MRALLDTSYIAHLVNGKRNTDLAEEHIARWRRSISVISLAELYGVVKSEDWNARDIVRLVGVMPRDAIPVSESDSQLHALYASIHRKWWVRRKEPRFRSLGQNDMWIAATAMRLGAFLVTSDAAQAKFAPFGGYHSVLVLPGTGELEIS